LGYEELYKFLNLLGTVFGWVASDVHAKLEVNLQIFSRYSVGKNKLVNESEFNTV
jgi:hypothetical protein